MRKDDIASSIFLMILSLLICIGASYYRIGSFKSPDSGFFPFLLGAGSGLLSLTVLIRAFLGKGMVRGEERQELGGGKRKKVFFILVLLTFCGFFLERLGYLLTIFIFFLFLLSMVHSRKWYIVLGGAFLASLGSYAIFKLSLHVELPRGILGI